MTEFDYDLGIDGLGSGTRIGEGGSAVVYRARQEELDRDVAVKLLGFAADADTLRRFDRERRLMGRLSQHEGIVTVHETGFNSRGEPYIVMPLLDGSLDDEISVEPMAWDRAAVIIVDVCRTVGFAHDQGVVHRDLKPGNIMLSTGGRPLVADFGIARIVDTNTNLEATTLALTPAYSPPEALTTTVAQPSGDVYSLGATLYALIMGHPPYLEKERAPSLMVLMHNIVNDPVPNMGSSAPVELQTVLERAMAKRPEDRFPTVNELGDALDSATRSVLSGQDANTVRVPPRVPLAGPLSRRPLILAAAALTIVTVTAIGVWQLIRDDPPDIGTAATVLEDPSGAGDGGSQPVIAADTTTTDGTTPVVVESGLDSETSPSTSEEPIDTLNEELRFKSVADDVTSFEAPTDWTIERAFTRGSFYDDYPEVIEHTLVAVTDTRTDDGFFDEEGFGASASFELVDQLGLREKSSDDFAEAAEPFLKREFDWSVNCAPNRVETTYAGVNYHGIVRTWESCGDNATTLVDGLLVDMDETHAVVIQLRPGMNDVDLLVEHIFGSLKVNGDSLATEISFQSDEGTVIADRATP